MFRKLANFLAAGDGQKSFKICIVQRCTLERLHSQVGIRQIRKCQANLCKFVKFEERSGQ
jgi:hypothetical protein